MEKIDSLANITGIKLSDMLGKELTEEERDKLDLERRGDLEALEIDNQLDR